MSLRTVCAPEGRPELKTIFNWFRTQPGFLQQYEKAKAEAADMMTEDMQDIADNPSGDVQRDRLRIDVRKWAASKLKPKKYGDKLDVTSDGQQLGVILYPKKDENSLATDTSADQSTTG